MNNVARLLSDIDHMKAEFRKMPERLIEILRAKLAPLEQGKDKKVAR